MDYADAWRMISAVKQGGDWSLDKLVRLVDETSLPFPLGLIVHGNVVLGTLVKAERWADHLDGVMDGMLGFAADALSAEQSGLTVEQLGVTGVSAGDMEQWRASWPEHGWRQLVDERRSNTADFAEQLDAATGGRDDFPFDELPDDLARNAIELDMSPPAFTLSEVKLYCGGSSEPLELSYLRVLSREVAAWWPRNVARPE